MRIAVPSLILEPGGFSGGEVGINHERAEPMDSSTMTGCCVHTVSHCNRVLFWIQPGIFVELEHGLEQGSAELRILNPHGKEVGRNQWLELLFLDNVVAGYRSAVDPFVIFCKRVLRKLMEGILRGSTILIYPRAATERAARVAKVLLVPLIDACNVEVTSTSGAVSEVFRVHLQLVKTDGAVPLDILASRLEEGSKVRRAVAQ